MDLTAPLERYIQRVLCSPSAQIFTPYPHHAPPTLIRGQVNHILSYRGSFNPPHQAHMDALCHAFFRGGPDLNIIAAYIVPVEDSGVRRKLARQNSKSASAFTLTRDQRIALWDSGGLRGGWHFFHTRSFYFLDDKQFKKRLKEECKRDGFEIEWVRLLGPDWVEKGSFDGKTIVCGGRERAEWIDPVSLEFRAVRDADGEMWGEWGELSGGEKTVERVTGEGAKEWIGDKMKMLVPGGSHILSTHGMMLRDEVEKARLEAVKARIRSHIERLGPIRQCFRPNNDPKHRLRFVPIRALDSKQMAISSTVIRGIIWNATGAEELFKQLDGIALNPKLLLQFIQQLDWKHRSPHLRKCVLPTPPFETPEPGTSMET